MDMSSSHVGYSKVLVGITGLLPLNDGNTLGGTCHTYKYIYIPGTCECPLFWGLNPAKEWSFPIKTRDIWVTNHTAYLFCW